MKKAVLLGGLLLAVTAVTLPWFWAPLSYDEGYNLQVVAHLLDGHGYATSGALFGSKPEMFDYRITTGPVLLLPVTAVAWASGPHVWAFRIVPTLMSLGLYVAWWVLARRLVGPYAAMGAVVSLLALDNTRWIGNQRFGPGSVVGENASVLLVLLAVLTLRRPWLSGLFVGLAVLTKLVAVFAVPGVLLGLVLMARQEGKSSARALLVAGATSVAPVLAWQAFRLASVGWSGAVRVDRAFWTFAVGNGARLAGSTVTPVERLALQVGVLGIGGAVGLVLALILVIVGSTQRLVRVRAGSRPELVAVLVAGVAWETWWLTTEKQGWVRHSTQATELLVPMAVVLAVAVLERLPRPSVRHVLAFALPAMWVVGVAEAVDSAWAPPGPSLADQRHVAAQVRSYGTDFWFVQDFQDPELSILEPSLRAHPLGPHGGLLVLSGMRGPNSEVSTCDRVLDEYADYVICRVHPSRMPSANAGALPAPRTLDRW